MYERTKRITQYYKTLEYEINKLEALKKISTLHCELKFKDANDFSYRFLLTASIIEKNISVFKAACDHVDIIITLIEHLNAMGVSMKFNNKCSVRELKIIGIMLIICEEPEIPLFLKAALINKSRLEYVDEGYKDIISDYVSEMIVLEDADLYAVISYLKITPFFLLKLKSIFVQISIKQKFLWLIEKYFKFISSVDLPIIIFQSRQELLLASQYSPFTEPTMMSIWSDDIIFAKELAITLNKDIIFINAHLEFCYRITLHDKAIMSSLFDMANMNCLALSQCTDRDKIYPNKGTGSLYNLFYAGETQIPVKNTYWIHNDNNIYAEATEEDVFKCLQSSHEALRTWSTWPIASRVLTLLKLAHTLECNGKFLLANTVVKWTEYSNILENKLSYHGQDEKLEVISIRTAKGIVSLQHCDETVLFTYLTISLIIGNCVVVICNQNSCNLAPYCNMFSTSEIPPGVINLLSNQNMLKMSSHPFYSTEDIVYYCSSLNNIVVSLK